LGNIIESIKENPIVAGVRHGEDLQLALDSGVSTVFILNTDIFNVKSVVSRVKAAGKNVLVHIDFVEGLGKDQKAIDFIAQHAKPDGILTTKSQNIKYAREIGLFAIQRFFLIDSLSFKTTIRTIQSFQPDMIEIMPAVMPGVIKNIVAETNNMPVIAGGLINTKKDIIEALNAGALGVSTGKKELWAL
jgi:glycerol uptake operon antiterminator